jgi:hypothetical protein
VDLFLFILAAESSKSLELAQQKLSKEIEEKKEFQDDFIRF